LTVVEGQAAEAFIAPLSVRKIPGIGPKTEEFLHQQGISLVQDLKRFSREELQGMFGKWGLELYEKVRGRDDSPIQEAYEVKSVGEQETFAKDTRFQRDRGPPAAMCEDVAPPAVEAGLSVFEPWSLPSLR
jgi:nucleotidyltransferase/DNA polymerase involved in DNA repair